jgi:hypothetical protein
MLAALKPTPWIAAVVTLADDHTRSACRFTRDGAR